MHVSHVSKGSFSIRSCTRLLAVLVRVERWGGGPSGSATGADLLDAVVRPMMRIRGGDAVNTILKSGSLSITGEIISQAKHHGIKDYFRTFLPISLKLKHGIHILE